MAALEFALDPADIKRLVRWPGMTAGRAVASKIIWHDTTDGALAAQDLALCAVSGVWRLSPLRPPVFAVPSQLEEARRVELMLHRLPQGLGPVAVWVGRRRTCQWVQDEETVEIQLLDGQAGGVPVCRMTPGASIVVAT